MQTETLWIDADQRRANFHHIRNLPSADGRRHPFGLSVQQLNALGYQEITIYERPDDFSDRDYYRHEIDVAPYVTYERKPQAQIDDAHNAEIQAQITSLERTALETGLVRTLIEDLLDRALDRAAAALGYQVPLSAEDKAAVNAILLNPSSPNYSRPYAKVFSNAEERAVLRGRFR